jgi:PGF-pre-PGF domain-containing protein/uncharacterized repeat protein (TIGR01451 family)
MIRRRSLKIRMAKLLRFLPAIRVNREGGYLEIFFSVFLGLLVFAGGVSASSGGPDSFGYYFRDSNSGEPYNWIEISGTGAATGVTGDDDSALISIGFPFQFYGNTYTSVYVSSNGFLTFGSSSSSSTGGTIPSTSTPNAVIAPFWDDLDPSEGGTIYYQVFGATPNRYLVVEWYNVPSYSAGGDSTFEAILYESGGLIKFQYEDVYFADSDYDYGASATVGIENPDGTDGLVFSQNSPDLEDGFSILFFRGLLAEKRASVTEVIRGQNIIYNITYHNTYGDNVSDLVIHDFLPENVTYLSDTCGGTLSGGTLTMNIGNLSGNTGGYCEVNVTVKSTTKQGHYLNNMANLSFIAPDGNATNKTITAQTRVANPEVVISKTSSSCVAVAGGTVNFTVSYSNPSLETARNVVIKDYLPYGLEYISDDGGGSYSSGVVTFTLGDLAAGASGNVTITVQVNSSASGVSRNNATVTYENDDGATFTATDSAFVTIDFDIVVDKKGSTAYTTIQAGVNAATAGSTLFVCPGTYQETVDINKPLSIIGAGADYTIVDANGASDFVFDLDADNINLTGFTITGSTTYGINIRYYTYDVEVSYNNIVNNGGYGMYLYYTFNSSIHHNNITGSGDYGIYMYYSENNALSNNRITGSDSYNVRLYYSDGNTFSGNNISYCQREEGIYLYYSDDNWFQNNVISHNDDQGVYSSYSHRNTYSGNTIAHNNNENIYLSNSNNNTVSGNNLSHGSSDGILLSYSTGNNLSGNTLGNNGDNGLELSYSDNNVLINNTITSCTNNGIYLSYSGSNTLSQNTMTGNRYNFHWSGDGTDIDNTIDTSNTVDGKPVYYLKNVDFTVYDGSSNAGTFYCFNCFNITVRDLNLTRNYRGVYFWNTNRSTVTNVSASSNYYGIKLVDSHNNSIIDNNNSFVNNVYGIYLDGSDNNTIRNSLVAGSNNQNLYMTYSDGNTISGNNLSRSIWWEGVYAQYSHNNLFSNNIVDHNYDSNFYLYYSNGNRIVNNTASFSTKGHGMYLHYSDHTSLENNTVSSNGDFDNGIYLYYSDNCDLTGNTADNNSDDGIQVEQSYSTTLTDNRASNNTYSGIYIKYSENTTVTGSLAANNGDVGMNLYYSRYSTLTGNTMTGNRYNFGVSGTADTQYNHTIDTTNTLDGRPLYYLVNASGGTYGSSTNVGAFYCIWCDGVTVRDQVLEKNSAGVLFWRTTGSLIENVTAATNTNGIYLGYSSGNTLRDINASYNSDDGISLYYSDGNVVNNSNSSYNGDDGLDISNSNNNSINANFVVGNAGLDFQVTNSQNTGVNNTCDRPDGWNDQGALGCTYTSRPLTSYPDFVVTDIAWTPSSFNMSQTITINVTVRNLGPANATGGFYVGFYVDGVYQGSTWVASILNVSQGVNATFNWYITKGGANRTLTAKADYNNYWTEYNDTNNELNATLPYIPGPDLVVSNITWTPASPAVGNSVTFYASVTNIGDAATTAHNEYVGFWVDGSWLGTGYGGWITIAPGQTVTISRSWTATPGDHNITAKADYSSYVYELDETNNELTMNLPHIAGPDLIVEDITWTPTNPARGDYVTFTATVKNIGDGPTGGEYKQLRWFIDGSYYSYSYTYNTIGVNGTFNYTLGWTATPGNHTIRAYADYSGSVSELNESNNDRTESLAHIAGPDLVVTNITWSPANYSPGDTVTFTATVKNIGETATGAHNQYVNFYIDGSYVSQGYAGYIDIAVGGTVAVTGTWTGQGGSHTVKAMADGPGYLSELNESNNYKETAMPYVMPPDLIISNLTWTPYNYTAGETITFNATVKNIGTVGWTGSTRVDFYSWNTTYITSTSPTLSIPAGGEAYVTATWSDVQAGDFYFRAQVDPNDAIDETDETNNDLYVRSPNIPRPDLVVEDITLSVHHRVLLKGNVNDGIYWNYTTSTPPAGWQNLSFDDSNWTRGEVPIGDTGSYRTYVDLNVGNMYLRKVFNASSGGSYTVNIASDDGVDVWVNGNLVLNRLSDAHGYGYWSYSVDITPYVTAGENILAIHLRDGGGANYIDAEVVRTETGPPGTLDIQAGDVVTINATIGNQGPGNMSSWYMATYFGWSGPYQSGSTSRWKTFPALPVNGTDYITYDWTVQHPGNYSITVQADYYYNYVREASESNNALTVTTREVPKADLVVEDITWQPIDYSAGQSVTLTATLKNMGPGYPGRYFSTRFYIDGSSIGDTYYSGTIPPGGRINVTRTWTGQAGNHTVAARADVYGYIYETDENNNYYSENLSAVLYPDLVITNVTASTDVALLQRGDRTPGVWWNYTTTVPPAGWQNLTFNDSNWSTGQAPMGDTGSRRTYLDLNCGQGYFRKVFNTSYTGTHTLYIASDDGVDVWLNGNQVLAKSSDVHGYGYWSYTIDITPHIQQGQNILAVYLKDGGCGSNYLDAQVMAHLEGTPSEIAAIYGQTVTFNATLKNIGKGDIIGGSLKVGFYTGGTERASGTVTQDLPVNGTAQVTATWKTTPGDHTSLVVRADPGNGIWESNESNNDYSTTFISVPYPDLVVDALYASPQVFDAGQTVTFTATIRNNGTGGYLYEGLPYYWWYSDHRRTYVYFYIDGSYKCSGYKYVNLYPGTAVNITCTWTATAGEHNLSATVDAPGYISESNEGNNQLEVPLNPAPFPDLTIQNLTWSPAAFDAGDLVTFTATVKNIGEGNVSTGWKYVGFYVNGVWIGSGSAYTAARVNETFQVSRTWTATAGNHTLRGYADPWNYVSESKENNNELTVQLPSTSFPDLVVEDISWPDTSGLTYGESITLTATVRNNGTGNFSNCFYTRFLVDGSHVGDHYRCGLAAGEAFNATVSWQVASGNHTIRAVGDYYGHVTEAREDNNDRSETLGLTVPLPDFSISSISVQPPTLIDGQTATLKATISNQGPGSTVGGYLYVRFYVDGNYISQQTIYDGIAAGSSKEVSVSWTPSEGNHTIKVLVDYGNYFEETNESNNEGTLSLSYTFDAPDLTVTGISPSKTNLSVGEYVRFYANVTNLGGETRRCLSVGFYVDGKHIGTVSQRVACGILENQTLISYYHWYAKPGSHTVTVRADPSDQIPETNETNNEMAYNLPAIPYGDLVITNVTYSPTTGVQPGDTVTLKVEVMNNDTGNIVDNVYVRAEIAGVATGRYVGAIPAGENRTALLTWTALPGSNFSVSVQADPYHSIAESREDNNGYSTTLAMDVPYPDLVVENVTWSPSSGIRDEDYVTFNITVKNIGGGRARNVYPSVLVGSERISGSLGTLGAGSSASVLVIWRARVGTNFSVTGNADIYGRVIESNENNNDFQAGLIAEVLPKEKFSVSLTPGGATLGLGGGGVYKVAINNYGSAVSNYSIGISGLEASWYTLERSTVYLGAGETTYVKLNVTIPFNCSMDMSRRTITATVKSLVTNTTKAATAYLDIDPGYTVLDLSPGNNYRVGSTSATITWKTRTNATSTVYVREAGGSNWTIFNSSAGYHHAVILTNRTRNLWHEYYVESNNSCGSGKSGTRQFYVDNGISFTHREYTFNIERDYNQLGYLYITNTDSVSHQVLVKVTNPYEDLIVGFVGAGSVDQLVTLTPGQTKALDFRMHTQDAERTSYDLVVNLTNYDAQGASQNITDYATVHINVHFPVTNFTLEETDSNPITLEKTFKITNHGDTITDLAVYVDDSIKDKVSFEPSVSHGYLPSGGSMTITATPLLEVGSTGFNGTLFVSGAGKTINTSVDFRTAEGEVIYEGRFPATTIEFSPVLDSDDSNNTNPLNGSVVDSVLINGSQVYIGDIVALVKQSGYPVLGVNVTLVISDGTTETLLYSVTDPMGLAVFRVHTPLGNYSYRAEARAQNASTETRHFTVNTTPYLSFAMGVEWVSIADADSTYAGSADNLVLDRAPYRIKANLTNPLLNATAYLVLRWHFMPTQKITLQGTVNGSEVDFETSAVSPGNYSALIMVVSDTQVLLSETRNLSFTDDSLRNFQEMTLIRHFDLNESDDNITSQTIVAKKVQEDPRKAIVLENIYLNDEKTAFVYDFLIVSNESMNDTLIVNVKDANGTIVYHLETNITLLANKPLSLNVSVPVEYATGDYTIEVITLDPGIVHWVVSNGLKLIGVPEKAANIVGSIVNCAVGWTPFGAVTAIIDLGKAVYDLITSPSLDTTMGVVGGAGSNGVNAFNAMTGEGARFASQARSGFKALGKFGGPILGCIQDLMDIINEFRKEGTTIRKTQRNWRCTNRPVVSDPVDIPHTVPKYLDDGTPNIDGIWFETKFDDFWAKGGLAPFDTIYEWNGYRFAALYNEIPLGHYGFGWENPDPSYLYTSTSGSGRNYITTYTRGLNPGHYAQNFETTVNIHVKQIKVQVPAKDQQEANQRISSLVSYYVGKPDAVIPPRDVKINTSRAKIGDTINISATVHNYGTEHIRRLKVYFYENGVLIGTRMVYLIPPGGSRQVSLIYKITHASQHTYEVKVDPYNDLSEEDETNNGASQTLTVGTPDPDLEPTSIIFTPSSPTSTDTINATVTVRNNGNTTLSQPVNVSLEVNSTPQYFSTTVDMNGLTEVNVTFTFNASLGNHTVTATADPLNVIAESDEGNNVLVSTLYVEAVDKVAPLVTISASGTVELGINYTVNITATDDNPGYYNLTRDGSLISIGAYTSAAPVTVTQDSLSLGAGSYVYIACANDTTGNSACDTAIVTIQDTTPPAVTITSPWNMTYTTNNITLEVELADYLDISGMNYSLDSGANTSFNYSATLYGLANGAHTLEVYAVDASGNLGSASVNFTVNLTTPDVTPPIVFIYSPVNTTYAVTSIALNWSSDEVFALAKYSLDGSANVTIYGNDTLVGLSAGSHSLMLYVWDTAFNLGTSSVDFTVQDTTPPQINISIPSVVEKGEYYNATVTIVEARPDSYNLTRNGTPLASGTYSSGVPLAVTEDSLSLGHGTFVYEICAKDTVGNSACTTATVLIQDTTPPAVSISAPSVVEKGTNYTVNITVTDLQANSYNLTRNGTPLASGTYSSGVPLAVTEDSLSLGDGTFVYEICAKDTVGNSACTTATVLIQDTTAPIFSSLVVPAWTGWGDTVNFTFAISDLQPDTYMVYENGTLIATGTYASGVAVSVPINTSVLGTWNYTLWARDTAGNGNSTGFQISVVDTTPPQITILSPKNITLTADSVILEIDAQDVSAITAMNYSLDGGVNTSFNWSTVLTGLTKDTHNLTVYVVDEFGNLGSATVSFLVSYATVDVTPPGVTISSPANTTYGPGDIAFNWSSTETVSMAKYSLDGGANVTLLGDTTLTGLTHGPHRLDLYVWDASFNLRSARVDFTVDLQPPVITVVRPKNNSNLSVLDNTLEGSVTDDTGVSQVAAYLDGTLVRTWSTGGSFVRNLSLASGSHTILVKANDTFNNTATEMVYFTVYQPSVGISIPVVEGQETQINETLNTTAVELIIVPTVTGTVQVQVNVSTDVNELENATNVSDFSAFAVAQEQEAISKFVRIDVSGAVNETENLSSVMLKMYYTAADLDRNGNGTVNLTVPEPGDIDPTTLNLYRFCPADGTWTIVSHGPGNITCGNDTITVYNSSVNTSAMFVWANLSHFSVYGLGGSVYGLSGSVYGISAGIAGEITSEVTTLPGEVRITTGHVIAGGAKTFSIPEGPEVYLTELRLAAHKFISGSISARTLLEKPGDVPSAPGEVYTYMEISLKDIKPEDVKEVTFTFKVKKSWLDLAGIDPATVALYRFTTAWDRLDTSKVDEDNTYIYYSALSPGFSYFAIAGGAEELPPTTTAPPVTPPPATTVPPATTAPPVTTAPSVTTAPPVTVAPPVKPPVSKLLQVLIALVVVVAIVAVAYALLTRRQR